MAWDANDHADLIDQPLLIIAGGKSRQLLCGGGIFPEGGELQKNDLPMNNSKTGKILFINGSSRKDGNTAALAKTLLEGQEYATLMLTDYRINSYGQTLEGDQFD